MAKQQPTEAEETETPPEKIANAQVHELSVQRAKGVEAMGLHLAGLTHEQIAERMGLRHDAVEKLITRQLERTANRRADQMRTTENARLDRAQAAIWPKVLQGDVQAVRAYLAISERRAKMNGLDAPKQIALSANVRVEMETALADLQKIVMGEVVQEALDD